MAATTTPAAMAGQGLQHRRRRVVVLFSLPFQGHLNPMLKLASLLAARGLGVTVLHTDFNAPDPTRHPAGLAFVPIHETLPGEATSPYSHILTKLLALNAACEAPFREVLASLLMRARHRDDDVAATPRAAAELGVPVLALRTDSAAAFRNMLAIPRLRDAGFIPIKGKQQANQE
nr:unnamed protein product [Digitaria exilis]